MGLFSDGGVHSYNEHLYALLELCRAHGIEKVFVHAFADGRDTAPHGGIEYAKAFEAKAAEIGVGELASVVGRYYAMDRDNRWERVESAYDAMIKGEGGSAATPLAAIDAAYAAGKTDEFIPATVIGDYAGIGKDDGFFCLNFRSDRAREILAAIADPDFDGFERVQQPLAALLGMVSYSDRHDAWFDTVFPKRDIQNTLGAWVAKHGLRQFRLAETEKYPHVTYFFNGGAE